MPKTKRNEIEQLVEAIGDHDIKTLQALLASGADANAKLNSKPHGNLSVLGYAAGCQFGEGAEALLKAGADVNYCSSNISGGSGRTALYEAVIGDDWRPSNAANPSKEEGRLNLVNILLKAGANANEVGDGDCLPLSAAAASARYEICLRLIESGAACKTWPVKCAPPLLAVAGGGPFKNAARDAKQEQIARLFLSLGAPVDGDSEGYTPLMGAALKGCEVLVNLFLEHGANVNRQDSKFGRTPLICAALFYQWDGYNEAQQQRGIRIIKRLLAAGAAPAMRNSKGENALEIVSKSDNPAAANLIREYMQK